MITLKPKHHLSDFNQLGTIFKTWLETWAPIKNSISISEYFRDKGVSGSIRMLHSMGLLEEDSDIKGIYVFIQSGIPFYVGISGHVVKRITQHVKGTSHFTSSLCYRLGAELHLAKMGFKHQGGRKGLDFPTYAEPAKQELVKCDVAFLRVNNDLELYLFEAFMAMELGTLHYNEFKTH